MLSHCLVSTLFTPRVRILRRGRTYVLGRDRRCDFPLPSDVVSRRHAEILWHQDGGFRVRDLGSKNGTKINKEVIDEVALRDGDSIWLGPFHLTYREYEGDISGLLEEAAGSEQTVSMSRDMLTGGGSGTFAFGGRFAGSELLEICQLLGFNEKRGVLNIQAGELRGSLAFDRGNVIRARLGPISGQPAAISILGTAGGTFEFVTGDPGETEFQISTERLIMEAARRTDEGTETMAYGTSVPPPGETMDEPPSSPAVES